MNRVRCQCGATYAETSDNVLLYGLTCNSCDTIAVSEWLKTQPRIVKIDEWQHRHAPKWPKGQRVLAAAWYWLWRPLCAAVERHHTGMWRPR